MADLLIEEKSFPKRGGGRATVLRDVRLAVAPGEIVALLGASGTGKSTTLRILLGLDRRFRGRIEAVPASIAACFQEPELLPWRSVAENVRLVLPNADDAAIEALLAEVGLAGTGPLYPRQISLGMARRVALARALAVQPALLVLDEPFASLDPATSARVAAIVAARVRTGGMAAVLATHDVAQATALARRVIVLAGAPASVAARVDIAAADGAAARAGIAAGLRHDFPFLDDAAG